MKSVNIGPRRAPRHRHLVAGGWNNFSFTAPPGSSNIWRENQGTKKKKKRMNETENVLQTNKMEF